MQRAELDLDRLEDGAEEVLLVLEVVVEGAAGHAGFADEVLGGRVGVAALGEEAAGDGDKLGASLFGLLRFTG